MFALFIIVSTLQIRNVKKTNVNHIFVTECIEKYNSLGVNVSHRENKVLVSLFRLAAVCIRHVKYEKIR